MEAEAEAGERRSPEGLMEVRGLETVLDYLEKYGKYSFEEMPMTEVDSLALCQLAYLKFDGMVPELELDFDGKAAPSGKREMKGGGQTSGEDVPGQSKGKPELSEGMPGQLEGAPELSEGVPGLLEGTPGLEGAPGQLGDVPVGLFQDAAVKLPQDAPEKPDESQTEQPGVTLESLREHPDYEKLFADVRYEKPNRALYERMVQGKRFQNLRLNYYVNVIEEQWETQFSAVTYTLGDGTHYVAYRGTDETIVGWKEDFNMAFLSPVPGQAISADYLNRVAERFDGTMFVGGHSKGGNLAVYSAMNCPTDVQERILKVYSLDGPGFRPEVLRDCGYERIADRVVKILPNSSLVGMIFESGMYFQVVKSKAFGLLQHDLYTWLVVGNHLVRADHLYERRQQMDNNLNEWILSLNEEQLRTFVDTLYQVITASEADNLIDFTAEWKKSMNGIIAALKEVDEATVEALKEIVRSLFEITKENRRKQMTAKAEAAMEMLAPKGGK